MLFIFPKRSRTGAAGLPPIPAREAFDFGKIIDFKGPTAAEIRAALDRRGLPRGEPDRRVSKDEQAASGRPTGERRTGGPLDAWLAQLKEFAVSKWGIVLAGFGAVGLALTVYARARKRG